MIPVVITSSAYQQDEAACMRQVSEMIQSMPSRAVSLLIDSQSLKINTDSMVNSPAICHVILSEWIDSTAHQPLKVVIRTSAKNLGNASVILLDARHYDVPIIESVLSEVSQAWFHIKTWQPAFILVVDDYLATRLARTLSDVFYIKSHLTSKQVMQSEMVQLRRRIFSRRWLGFGRASRLVGVMYQFSRKLKHYVHRKLS